MNVARSKAPALAAGFYIALIMPLEFSVVIDVAMTETAREADYVLPASSQYEKPEAVFFTHEFPDNVFTLRKPVLPPLPGTLPEPEIHTRILEEMGAWAATRPSTTLARCRRACSSCRSRGTVTTRSSTRYGDRRSPPITTENSSGMISAM